MVTEEEVEKVNVKLDYRLSQFVGELPDAFFVAAIMMFLKHLVCSNIFPSDLDYETVAFAFVSVSGINEASSAIGNFAHLPGLLSSVFLEQCKQWRQGTVSIVKAVYCLRKPELKKLDVPAKPVSGNDAPKPVPPLKRPRQNDATGINVIQPSQKQSKSYCQNQSMVHDPHVLQDLAEEIQQITPESSLFHKFGSDDTAAISGIVVNALSHQDKRGLSMKLKFWKWLKRNCAMLGISPFSLNAVQVIQIWTIKSVASKMTGTTFQSSMNWAEKVFGISNPKNLIIKSAISNTQINFAKKHGPARTPHVSDVCHLEYLASSGTTVACRFMAALFLVAIWASLRIIDLVRSRLIVFDKTKGIAIFEMSTDKTSKLKKACKGKTPVPFAIPLKSLLNTQWWNVIFQAPFVSEFLVPNFASLQDVSFPVKPSKGKKTTVSGSWLKEIFSMASPYNHRVGLEAGVAAVNPLEGGKLTGHSFRHFLPTVGDFVHLDEDQGNLLGRWTRLKAKDGTMSKRYSSARMQATIQGHCGLGGMHQEGR